MVRVQRFIRLAVVAAASLLLATGCVSFNHAWNAAANNPTPANDLEGRWDGFWRSDVNGHDGKLRCLITKSSERSYKARFHANYGKVLSFNYTATLKAEATGDSYQFSGQANLGWFAGGVYYYEGHAEKTNFFSKYSNKYDHGIFQMSRP